MSWGPLTGGNQFGELSKLAVPQMTNHHYTIIGYFVNEVTAKRAMVLQSGRR
jgi:hypothetical protein